ncbi:uncharacterized protein BJ171DRAFT_484555 [Polychytrium aggregatum]|uniref:uncharacterized protein n=1 Tax=Polychytrium aggregatum TaxID=110093 RepID=UPI0022FE274B|nr:uncharacterized protein BJ171DRAFT_484555 [Polychytrium aggregatum]KAI9209621.1 hypothetical protein BJ171DRAFT_484555 [Polychytrium aggregatum]
MRAAGIDESQSHSTLPRKAPAPALESFGLPLTQEELSAFSYFFKIADVDSKGVITPPLAVAFMSKSKLSHDVLGEIWSLANPDKKAFLTRESFYKALKLIALSQSGRPASLASLGTACPLPTFEGIVPETAPMFSLQTMPLHRTGSLSAHATGSSFTILPEERERFLAAFSASQPSNGLVTGDNAREVFMKSGLPLDVLGSVWVLVDSKSTGKLTLNQFMVAMYIISRLRSGAMTSVPTSIPPGLFNAVSMANSASAGNVNSPPGSPILGAPPSKQSGSTASLSRRMTANFSTSGLSTSNPALSTPQPGAPSPALVLTPEARVKYGTIFDQKDSERKGFLTGGDAYPLFMESKLPSTTLAQVWDLADVQKAGRLTKDEFVAAMLLIEHISAGNPVPAVLPASLLSSTSKGLSGALSTPSLLDFDGSNASAGAPKPLQETGALKGTLGSLSSLSGLPALGGASSSVSVPPLGHASFASREAADLEKRQHDLAIRKTDIQSLQSQIDAITPNLEEIKAKRSAVDAELREANDTKLHLTVKLSQTKATYDSEIQYLQDTEAELFRERQTLQIAQTELARLEATVQLVNAEKVKLDEAKAQLLAESHNLKQRIEDYQALETETHRQIAELKTEIESVLQSSDIHNQVLQSAHAEHQSIQAELDAVTKQLEEERAKSTSLERQVAAQYAANHRDRERIKKSKAEKARLEAEFVEKQHELVRAVSEGQALADAVKAAETPKPSSKPVEKDIFSFDSVSGAAKPASILSQASVPSPSVAAGIPLPVSPNLQEAVPPALGRISSDPAPPVPSLSSKPTKSSEGQGRPTSAPSSESLAFGSLSQGAAPKLEKKDSFEELMKFNAPKSSALSKPSATPSTVPAGAPGLGKSPVVAAGGLPGGSLASDPFLADDAFAGFESKLPSQPAANAADLNDVFASISGSNPVPPSNASPKIDLQAFETSFPSPDQFESSFQPATETRAVAAPANAGAFAGTLDDPFKSNFTNPFDLASTGQSPELQKDDPFAPNAKIAVDQTFSFDDWSSQAPDFTAAFAPAPEASTSAVVTEPVQLKLDGLDFDAELSNAFSGSTGKAAPQSVPEVPVADFDGINENAFKFEASFGNFAPPSNVRRSTKRMTAMMTPTKSQSSTPVVNQFDTDFDSVFSGSQAPVANLDDAFGSFKSSEAPSSAAFGFNDAFSVSPIQPTGTAPATSSPAPASAPIPALSPIPVPAPEPQPGSASPAPGAGKVEEMSANLDALLEMGFEKGEALAALKKNNDNLEATVAYLAERAA